MSDIVTVDNYDQQQILDLLLLLDFYAQDPMSGAESLSGEGRLLFSGDASGPSAGGGKEALPLLV